MAAQFWKDTVVIAVPSAHDDNNVALTGELDGGILALLRRQTHGIDEANVGLRESLSHQRDKMTHSVDRLCGLRSHAETRMLLELHQIILVKNDVECREIFSQAAHLRVVALADDDRMI